MHDWESEDLRETIAALRTGAGKGSAGVGKRKDASRLSRKLDCSMGSGFLWLLLSKGERKTLLSRRPGEKTTHVDKNTAVTFWSRSASVSKNMTGKDGSRSKSDWKGNHHEVSSHLGWHQQRQHS
jgi:hypothetical protein